PVNAAALALANLSVQSADTTQSASKSDEKKESDKKAGDKTAAKKSSEDKKDGSKKGDDKSGSDKTSKTRDGKKNSEKKDSDSDKKGKDKKDTKPKAKPKSGSKEKTTKDKTGKKSGSDKKSETKPRGKAESEKPQPKETPRPGSAETARLNAASPSAAPDDPIKSLLEASMNQLEDSEGGEQATSRPTVGSAPTVARTIRPFEMPSRTSVGIFDPGIGQTPDLSDAVDLHRYARTYEGPKGALETYYDQGVRNAFKAEQARMGQLDGQWTLKNPDGMPLYTFLFLDSGQPSDPVQGAWRQITAAGGLKSTGMLSAVRQNGDTLELHVQPAAGAAVQILRLIRAEGRTYRGGFVGQPVQDLVLSPDPHDVTR
ncbi:MAG: hypothetical protein ACK41P_08050, partial [Asticcacaulis sp.]